MKHNEFTCKYRSRWVFFSRIFIVNLLIWGIFLFCLYLWGHSSFNDSLKVILYKITSISPETSVQHIHVLDQHEMISNLMGFYETVITILSVFLAIVSLIGFLYVRAVSREEVREISAQALQKLEKLDDHIRSEIQKHIQNDFFKAYMREHFSKILQEDINSGQMSDIINSISELEENFESLQKTVLVLQGIVEKGKNNIIIKGRNLVGDQTEALHGGD